MLPDFISSKGCSDLKTAVAVGDPGKHLTVYEHMRKFSELAECVIPDPRAGRMLETFNRIFEERDYTDFIVVDSLPRKSMMMDQIRGRSGDVVYFDIEASSDFENYGLELKPERKVIRDSIPGTPAQELQHFIKGLEL